MFQFMPSGVQFRHMSALILSGDSVLGFTAILLAFVLFGWLWRLALCLLSGIGAMLKKLFVLSNSGASDRHAATPQTGTQAAVSPAADSAQSEVRKKAEEVLRGHAVPASAVPAWLEELAASGETAAVMALFSRVGGTMDAAALRSVCGVRALQAAARAGQADTVEALVAQGIDINGRDEHEETPFVWAVSCGHLETVRSLLNLGADPELPDRFGVKPLQLAHKQGLAEIAAEIEGHRLAVPPKAGPECGNEVPSAYSDCLHCPEDSLEQPSPSKPLSGADPQPQATPHEPLEVQAPVMPKRTGHVTPPTWVFSLLFAVAFAVIIGLTVILLRPSREVEAVPSLSSGGQLSATQTPGNTPVSADQTGRTGKSSFYVDEKNHYFSMIPPAGWVKTEYEDARTKVMWSHPQNRGIFLRIIARQATEDYAAVKQNAEDNASSLRARGASVEVSEGWVGQQPAAIVTASLAGGKTSLRLLVSSGVRFNVQFAAPDESLYNQHLPVVLKAVDTLAAIPQRGSDASRSRAEKLSWYRRQTFLLEQLGDSEKARALAAEGLAEYPDDPDLKKRAGK